MTTAVGDFAINFAVAADQSPLANANLATVFGEARINGGALKCLGEAVLVKLVGKTYGPVVKTRWEYKGGLGYDWVGGGFVDDATDELNYRSALLYFAGYTPKLTISQDADYPASADEWIIGRYADILDLAVGDVFELERDTNFTPHRWTFRRNGTIVQTTSAENYVTNSVLTGTMVPAWFLALGDNADAAFGSIAVAGLAVSDTTAPSITAGPTAANVTLSGYDVVSTWDEGCTVSVLVTAPGAAQPSDAAFDASTEKATATAGTSVTVHHNG